MTGALTRALMLARPLQGASARTASERSANLLSHPLSLNSPISLCQSNICLLSHPLNEFSAVMISKSNFSAPNLHMPGRKQSSTRRCGHFRDFDLILVVRDAAERNLGANAITSIKANTNARASMTTTTAKRQGQPKKWRQEKGQR